LVASKDISEEEARWALGLILAGEASHAQIAAFAVALSAKGETAEEMTGFVKAMFDVAEPLHVDELLVDTCGTGGDGKGTANISTMAAFVVAGAGVKVCKHGGRAASSSAGSADVLEALGVVIDLGPNGVSNCIKQAGIGFCFAPRFHPAMRHAAPVRKELGIPTIFNYLGPLANPARLSHQVIGVNNPDMADKMIRVLAANGCERAMVVHGFDGLDEITTTTRTRIWELSTTAEGDKKVSSYELDTYDIGIPHNKLEDLRGGDVQTNARLLRSVLRGEQGPLRDIVVVNAAAALVVVGVAKDLVEGVALAEESIDSGKAERTLERLVAVSNAQASVESQLATSTR
jgi:anthranilate phosphoribosyltransferase